MLDQTPKRSRNRSNSSASIHVRIRPWCHPIHAVSFKSEQGSLVDDRYRLVHTFNIVQPSRTSSINVTEPHANQPKILAEDPFSFTSSDTQSKYVVNRKQISGDYNLHENIQTEEHHIDQNGMIRQYHESTSKNKKQKKRYQRRICLILLPIVGLIVGSIITGLCLNFFYKSNVGTTFNSLTMTSTTTSTSILTSSTTTNINCSRVCTNYEACVAGVCLGIGFLSITMTWSRPGDGDIVITTPNGRVISFMNRWPSNATDGGTLDWDDTVGMGPENVFWPLNQLPPPNGTYYVCFEPFSFSTGISTTAPVSVSVTIKRSSSSTIDLQRNFTSLMSNSYTCDGTKSSLLGSFLYP